MDILRIYTKKEFREAVGKAAVKMLGEEGYEPWWRRISM